MILDTGALIKGRRGKTTIFNILEYPPGLKNASEIIFPNLKDYKLAFEIIIRLRKIGKPVPVVDVLIAAISLNRNEKVLTTDRRHFEILREVIPDLVVEYL